MEGVHGENFHRVDLIFSCEYIDNMPDAVLHGDTNQVGIGWLDISTLNLQPLYPSKLRRQIMNYIKENHTKYILETKKPVIRNVWIRSSSIFCKYGVHHLTISKHFNGKVTRCAFRIKIGL